jgi:hypothetical protein
MRINKFITGTYFSSIPKSLFWGKDAVSNKHFKRHCFFEVFILIKLSAFPDPSHLQLTLICMTGREERNPVTKKAWGRPPNKSYLLSLGATGCIEESCKVCALVLATAPACGNTSQFAPFMGIEMLLAKGSVLQCCASGSAKIRTV